MDGSKQNGHWTATGVILSAHMVVLYECQQRGVLHNEHTIYIMGPECHGTCEADRIQ
jgi:hypothetical protein